MPAKDAIHAAAAEDMPPGAELPKTWPAIGSYLLAKMGLGAVFLGLLVAVYLDLKASNARYAQLAEANIMAMTALTAKIERSHENVESMRETIRRIEQSYSINK